MKKFILTGVSALAISAATGSTVSAAENGQYDWTGFYAGVHLGYGNQRTRFYTDSETSPGNCPGPAGAFCNISEHGNSLVFGGQAGFNYQINNFVLGVEADASWAGMAASTGGGWCCTARNSEIDTLASIRGRVGWAFDNILPYATAGLGYAHGVAHKDTNSQFDGRTTISAYGPVVGGGVEWAVNEHVLVRAEGMVHLFNDVATLSDDRSIHTKEIWVARLGLSYKF